MENAPIIYLDWNVFNKIEKLHELPPAEKGVYQFIDQLIRDKKAITPYSSAHISDLYRGYVNNPIFTPRHLENISRKTDNLCVVQYWREKDVIWHYRDPGEFLRSTTEETGSIAHSFSSLFRSQNDPIIDMLWENKLDQFRKEKIDESFKQIYAEPIFNSIYPRTKIEMTKLALCEDIYSFSLKIKTDYVLYKSFLKYLNEIKLRYPRYQKLQQTAMNKIIGLPKQLHWDELWEKASITLRESSNAAFDRIVNLFTSTDLKGYRQDERFANLIDDALHCFYGAHCDFFITIDQRCLDKAKKVYSELKIKTLAMTPPEFMKHIL